MDKEEADVPIGTGPPTEPDAVQYAKPLMSPPMRLLAYVGAVIATLIGTLIVLVVVTIVLSVTGAISLSQITLPRTGGSAALMEQLSRYPWIIVVAQWAFYVPLAVVTLLFAQRVDRRNLAGLGLSWSQRSWGDIGVGLACGSLLNVTAFGVAIAFGWATVTGLQEKEPAAVLTTLGSGLAMFVMVGIVEELVFRGYLLVNLAEWRGRAFGVAVSSTLFMLIHLGNPGAAAPLAMLSLAMVGVGLSLMYYLTGSLFLPMACHFAFDFTGLTIFFPCRLYGLPGLLDTKVTAPRYLFAMSDGTGVVDCLLLAAFLFGACLLAAARKRKCNVPERTEQ